MSKTIIDAKPKRPHHNMGADMFRGSRYRGVSKNKNKWQVSSNQTILFDLFFYSIDDDHDQLKKGVHWRHIE